MRYPLNLVNRGLFSASGLASEGGYSPDDLDEPLLQWALGTSSSYASDKIGDDFVLNPLGRSGTFRQPRKGRAYLFDGTATAFSAIPGAGSSGGSTMCCWVYVPSATEAGCFLKRGSQSNGYGIGIGNTTFENTGNKLIVLYELKRWIVTTESLGVGWHHVALVVGADGYPNIFLDGASVYTDTTGTPDAPGDAFFIGGYERVARRYESYIRDARCFDTVKNASQLAAIRDGAVDTVGLVGQYPCEEESGLVGYDVSTSARHLTLANINAATFHGTQSGIGSSYVNTNGYRLSGSVLIPKRIGDNIAANGEPLTERGQSPFPARTEIPCLTGDGTLYINAPHLDGTETVVSSEGTATPSISSGRIDIGSGETLANLLLSDGTYYSFQEGPGTSDTNRDVYDCSSGGNDADIVNGTVATFFGSRIEGGRDHSILYGGRIGANGCFVPGLLAGGNAADGNSLTKVAGKFSNPFSRINFNPYEAAELSGLNVETAYEVTDARDTVAPTDTKFRRTASDGDDRFLTFKTALTGTDLTDTETYVG